MFRKIKRPIYAFLVASLLAHFGFLLTLLFMRQPVPPPQSEKVEVSYVTPDELTPETEKPVLKKKAQRKEDQIVDQKNQLNHELDPNSHLLSAFSQKVLHETRAAKSGEFRNTAKGGQPDEGDKSGEKNKKAEADKSKHHLERGELPALKDLTPKFALTPGPQGPNSSDKGDPSQSDDYLKDVHTGMQTLLSTREFIYFSYYARIKQAIRQRWEPTVREKVKIIYSSGRNIASAHDRVTQVLVILNSKGELLTVKILGPSGVEALDDAAIEAFREAAPFPNPPKGMVEHDGTIKIRWDFVLEA